MTDPMITATNTLETSPKPSAGAITIKKEDPPTTVADLTTPSITVGTQVRLTGVVEGYDSLVHPERVEVRIDGVSRSKPPTWVHKSALEVIRQPFKRGEVVWSCGHDMTEGWLVVADESEGHALAILVDARPGHNVVSLDVRNYERRP